MIKEDFYTGEPINFGSPTNFDQDSLMAEQAASFGKYDYDPGTRMMMSSQPVSIYPGNYGYNTNVPFMNPPTVGLGSYPYQNQQYGYYQGQGNPAIAYMQQQQQNLNTEITYFIKPVNFSGREYLPLPGFEKQIEELKNKYWNLEQEQIAKDCVDRSNSVYGFGYNYGTNYYGTPYYYNPYQYNSMNAEIGNCINRMQEEARQNRVNFSVMISKLAHNIAGHKIDEAEIRERYTGKTVTAPAGCSMTYADLYQQNKLYNLVPFDNSQQYRDFHAAVSREFNEIIPKGSNLADTLDNMGILGAQYELEKEQHRRRNGGLLYNSDDNSYKYFVRAKAAERYAEKNGGSLTRSVLGSNNPSMPNSLSSSLFPTLSQSAKLCDDGTLNITCNFGSKAGQVYSVHNSQEAGYIQDKERFNNFLNSIPGNIYNPGGESSG